MSQISAAVTSAITSVVAVTGLLFATSIFRERLLSEDNARLTLENRQAERELAAKRDELKTIGTQIRVQLAKEQQQVTWDYACNLAGERLSNLLGGTFRNLPQAPGSQPARDGSDDFAFLIILQGGSPPFRRPLIEGMEIGSVIQALPQESRPTFEAFHQRYFETQRKIFEDDLRARGDVLGDTFNNPGSTRSQAIYRRELARLKVAVQAANSAALDYPVRCRETRPTG